MSRIERHSRGITLVELLVVLAIIATLAAVVVPTFASLGAFAQNDDQYASRLLHSMLTAARTYASTHRTDAALVYGINVAPDSEVNTARQYIDSWAIARALKPEERDLFLEQFAETLLAEDETIGSPAAALAEAAAFWPAGARRSEVPLVLVGDDRGEFRRLPGRAAVLPIASNEGATVPLDVRPFSTMKTETGLAARHVFRSVELGIGPTGEPEYGFSLVRPRLLGGTAGNPQYAVFEAGGTVHRAALRLPAHVFTPTGELRGGSTQARVTLRVGYVPSENPEVRFSTIPTEDGEARRERNIPVVIYGPTGRVVVTTPEEVT